MLLSLDTISTLGLTDLLAEGQCAESHGRWRRLDTATTRQCHQTGSAERPPSVRRRNVVGTQPMRCQGTGTGRYAAGRL